MLTNLAAECLGEAAGAWWQQEVGWDAAKVWLYGASWHLWDTRTFIGSWEGLSAWGLRPKEAGSFVCGPRHCPYAGVLIGPPAPSWHSVSFCFIACKLASTVLANSYRRLNQGRFQQARENFGMQGCSSRGREHSL